MTRAKTFARASRGLDYQDRRDLAMEYLESIDNAKEAWELLWTVEADIDDGDVLHHLQFNPHLTYLDLEKAEVYLSRIHPDARSRTEEEAS